MKRFKHSREAEVFSMTDESTLLRAVGRMAAGMEIQGRARLRLPGQDARRLRSILKRLHALGAYSDEMLSRLHCEAGMIASCLNAAQEACMPMLPAAQSGPRILELMQALLAGGENRTDEPAIRAALAAFDSLQALEMRELHSACDALRIALLSACTQLLEEMLGDIRSRLAAEEWVEARGRRGLPHDCSAAFIERALQLSDEQERPELRAMLDGRIAASGSRAVWLVEQAQKQRAHHYLRLDNLMHARRLLERMDWQDCFETISPVESELCGDPSGVYPNMDDESRAAVRNELAGIARRVQISERSLARHVVRAAVESGGGICAFLMTDAGRRELLRRMGVPKKLPPMVPDPSGKRCTAAVCVIAAAVFALLSVLIAEPLLLAYGLPLAWVAAMEIIGRVFPKFVRPKRLLKMQVRHVPEDARTLVVLPVLLGDAARAGEMVRRMEVLGCLEQDENIDFLLLGDFRDAGHAHMDGDEAILETARTGVDGLNARAGRRKYYYLHRARRLREKDARWMGENRKRGALTALNRMLLGLSGAEEFAAEGADCMQLSGRYRYVVTLDADTEYLPGTLRKLIGAMLHPLNRRRQENGVACGYSILQPCMQMSLRSNVNAYVALNSGFGGMDAYPVTVSDLYQDMCGQGSFSGKGIYDLRAFHDALEGKLPDREILSHDLIEGILSGCAAVSDVCFYDEQPAQLGAEMNRLHRWTRGDWQLLRVLFGRLKLGALGRLKLAGNLLRSLYVPSLLGLMIHACWLDARSAFATALLIAYLVPLLHPFANGLHPWKAATFRLACLPVYAFVQSDAILRALWRLLVSRKKLMEWVPASDASGQNRDLHVPGRIAFILLLPGLMRPFWIPTVLALGALFLIGPAWAGDLADDRTEADALTPEQSAFLEELARRTWAFFEACVETDGAGLPPDNVQLDPPVGAAPRTSPTNIGLYMMSCLAAHELGFIDAAQMLNRLQATTATLEGLEKWHGQLYNWYDIHTLQPLHPRYVSSVDSGNLAGALLLCAQAVQEKALAARIRSLAEGMDLAVFFDPKRELFAIGADAGSGSVSRSYYDLYASESRILSYTAMMLGQVPLRHWQRLARPQQYVEGRRTLLSWSGTMFEYLMPELLLKSHPDSLAGRSSRAAVHAQMRFAGRCGRPWGVSESGHCQFDLQLNYQYRAFGLRSLALSGNAAQDVVAPYACALALCVCPQQAAENLRQMCALGWSDEHGLYEAADYTKRENRGRPQLVKSHMAHHQGMALCAICNALRKDVLAKTFLEIPQAQALRLLLEEKPGRPPRLRRSNAVQAECMPVPKTGAGCARSGSGSFADVHLLHGGALTLLANARGGLFASAHGVQINRFSGDLFNAAEGMYLHCSNLSAGEHTVIGSSGKTRFDAGTITAEACVGGVKACAHCFVSPETGIAYRQVEIMNCTEEAQEMELANCFAVALAPAEAMRAHPAFQNLFVSVRQVETNALVHTRRPRGKTAERYELIHAVCGEGTVTVETNMERLTGRCGLISRAGGIADTFAGAQAGVDPASALRIRFRVMPGETRQLHFAFALCSQQDRTEYLQRARSQAEAARARSLAEIKAQAVLNYAHVGPAQHRLFQRAAAFLADAHLHPGVNEEHAACGPASRQALWQAGISGDLPLVLVELSEDADMENIRMVIRMHAFYKLMGVAVDLVFLDTHGSDYRRDLRDALSDRIAASHLNCLRGERGGVFVVESANASEEFCATVRRIAATRLTAGQDVMAQLRGMLAMLPQGKTVQLQALPGVSRGDAGKLRFFNGYGGFDGEGAYQIEIRPGHVPPAPWCNILSNGSFGAVLTDRGGGFAWTENSRSGRLTPFLNDALHEGWGWLFRLSKGNQGVDLLPGKLPQTDYRVVFRPDRAVYSGACEGVRFETEISAVPEGICFEVMLEATSDSAQDYMLTAAVDWRMGTDAADAALLRCWSRHGACFASGASDKIGYFVSDSPMALSGGGRIECLQPDGSKAYGPGGWGLRIPLRLKSCEMQKIRFLLGAAEDIPAAYRCAKRFGSGITEKNEAEIRGILNAMKVETPDEAVNLLANGFLQAQTLHARILGRTGFYQPGGAYGFRDQLQDMLPLIYTAPQRVRSHLLYCAARQFPAGDVLHWWHDPYTGVRTRISDDLLFLPYVAARYVQVTGDAAILNESIPFLEEISFPPDSQDVYAEMKPSQEQDSLHGHCMRALRHAARFGEHGLCLMGGGDWNDGMNRVGAQGRGESVWLTEFLLVCAREYAQIAPDAEDAAWLSGLQGRLAETIEHSGWDGKWYLRAYADSGEALGSHSCRECRIDLISQAWAVMAGLDGERCRSALDAAWACLADPQAHIIKLLDPPFSGEDSDPGYIAAYPRGVRENGAQYTHAACWLLVALARSGDAERAHQALQYLLPIRHSDTPEKAITYRVEPYVMAGDVYAHPSFPGRGGWTWYTGSAAWMLMGIYELLGFERRGNRVRLNALLGSWPRASVTLQFGAAEYRLVSTGEVSQVFLDAMPVEGGFIEMRDDGKKHVAMFPCRGRADVIKK